MFGKKKVTPKVGRSFIIPDDKTIEVLVLLDAVEERRTISSKVLLWRYIGGIFPETIGSDWTLGAVGGQIVITEKLSD